MMRVRMGGDVSDDRLSLVFHHLATGYVTGFDLPSSSYGSRVQDRPFHSGLLGSSGTDL